MKKKSLKINKETISNILTEEQLREVKGGEVLSYPRTYTQGGTFFICYPKEAVQ